MTGHADVIASGGDRILVAQLTGTARHYARWRELSGDEEAAVVAGLRELAGSRADLLAEVAGILEGASEGKPGQPVVRQAAGHVPQSRSGPGRGPGLGRGRLRPPGARRCREASAR